MLTNVWEFACQIVFQQTHRKQQAGNKICKQLQRIDVEVWGSTVVSYIIISRFLYLWGFKLWLYVLPYYYGCNYYYLTYTIVAWINNLFLVAYAGLLLAVYVVGVIFLWLWTSYICGVSNGFWGVRRENIPSCLSWVLCNGIDNVRSDRNEF